jgi:hypothetical protein
MRRSVWLVLALTFLILQTRSQAAQTPVTAAKPPAADVRWSVEEKQADGWPVIEIIRSTRGVETVVRKVTVDEWTLDEKDCEGLCADIPGAHCYGKCFRGVESMLLDESRLLAFFIVSTGSGKNIPWVIFKLDLASGQLTRLGPAFGSAFGDTQLSRDGRVLSYLMASSGSAFEGSWNLMLRDTRSGVEMSLLGRLYEQSTPQDAFVFDCKSYRWTDADTIVFTVERRRRGDEEMRALDVTAYRYDVDTSRLTRRRDGRVIP